MNHNEIFFYIAYTVAIFGGAYISISAFLRLINKRFDILEKKLDER
ncbi:MAG: hypothetical protein H7A25_03535 [Leptospiraceae bacterium]|nr:hypothetical protein [Leptospiraceae bacterium]MCP5498948.1 hypothetical protein [Leptospiraceae bacterium]